MQCVPCEAASSCHERKAYPENLEKFVPVTMQTGNQNIEAFRHSKTSLSKCFSRIDQKKIHHQNMKRKNCFFFMLLIQPVNYDGTSILFRYLNTVSIWSNLCTGKDRLSKNLFIFVIFKDIVQPKKRGVKRGTIRFVLTSYTIADIFLTHVKG